MKRAYTIEQDKEYSLVVQTILSSGKVTKFTFGKILGKEFQIYRDKIISDLTNVNPKQRNKVILENLYKTDIKICNLEIIPEFEIFLEEIE